MHFKLATTLVLLSLSSVGCTHVQLRDNTVKQSETVSDIYTQQVLDNLAMFVYDRNALPSFAFPKEGSNQVRDMGGASTTIGWMSHKFDSALLGITADRVMQQTWTTDPIRDPHKLALMQCAYQHALSAYVDESVSKDCPDCSTILDKFYGDPDHSGGINKKCLQKFSEDYGWLGIGGKDDIPEDCDCRLVGKYCDTYVWVLPCNREKLTQLTLAILDFATFEPAKAEQKQVIVTIERDKNDNIVKTTRKETFFENKKDKNGRVIFHPGQRTNSNSNGILQIQQRLNTIR